MKREEEFNLLQGGIGLPCGFSGMVGYVDEGFTSGWGAPKAAPWTILPQAPSSSPLPSSHALHRVLTKLSNEQHPRAHQDHLPSQNNCPPLLPSLSHLPGPFTIPCTATRWIQQFQGALPSEGCHPSGSSGPRDPIRHYPQHFSLHGGSLVLDTARGELVNASKMTPKEILEAKALAASKSHSEAERRRRERINSHLSTLRELLPSSTKTDKASLLAEVVDHLRSLKRQVSEIYKCDSMPTDCDELSVEKYPASTEGKMLIKASVCCDDRLDIMTDLRHAVDTVGLRILKAQISTLGGRIKNVLTLTSKENSREDDQDICVNLVQEALKLVMERCGGGELSSVSSNKRQRVASLEVRGGSP